MIKKDQHQAGFVHLVILIIVIVVILAIYQVDVRNPDWSKVPGIFEKIFNFFVSVSNDFLKALEEAWFQHIWPRLQLIGQFLYGIYEAVRGATGASVSS
jgi:hypothetical protein